MVTINKIYECFLSSKMIFFLLFFCTESTVLIYLLLNLQLTAVHIYVTTLSYNANAYQFLVKSFRTVHANLFATNR